MPTPQPSDRPSTSRGASAPARPLRRDAAANRSRVLAAAAEVFDRDGLSASLEDVARRAGVGVGTVYRRFPTREALMEALLDDLLDAYALEAERALALPGGSGLEAYVRTVGEVQATPRGCALRLLGSETAQERRELLDTRTERLLEQAKTEGACRPDVTVDDVVGILVALRGIREAPATRARLDWRRHLELCLAGLRPAAAEPRPEPRSR